MKLLPRINTRNEKRIDTRVYMNRRGNFSENKSGNKIKKLKPMEK